MQSHIETVEDIDVLCLSGRLDLVAAEPLKTLVRSRLDQNRRAVVLDLQGVDFVNSSGLGTLVSILKEVRAAGGRLILCSMAPYVREVFYITQLLEVFEVHPDKSAAVSAVAALSGCPRTPLNPV